MKRTVFFFTTVLIIHAIFCGTTARADEGMWLPSLISQRIPDMQAKGFRLSAEDIYSINQASLKDAVVLFGRGCTGEVISAEGLLLTNHHCGYGQIQKHSSVEHDYLRDGFWAGSREEELPNKGLTVSFLERMEDVTGIILKGCTDDMSESERKTIVKNNSEALAREVTAEGKGLRASVEALYYGNQYFLFIYREYEDVRLVGAPPSSIGKFGGDTDNWMWPRHTGDFSIFRIYSDKDNNPAPYSEENVPYRPKRYLKISTAGVGEGDFTFVYGFPGRTQEYIHSEGVRYIEETGDQHKIMLRTLRLGIQKKYMAQSQKVRIQYSSKNASVANAWKKWQGEVKGLRKMGTVKAKQEYEKRFEEWAEGSVYEGITDTLVRIYSAMEPYSFATDYYAETARTVELARFALAVSALYDNGTPDSAHIASAAESFYKDYFLPIDKESFMAAMGEFGKNMPAGFQPAYFKEMSENYGSMEAWADDLFRNSIFVSEEKVRNLSARDSIMVRNDPAVRFAKEFDNWYFTGIRPKLASFDTRLSTAYRIYMKGQMDFAAAEGNENDFYPDANLTLRVAYGNVAGYSPADGIWYLPNSTVRGILEKDNPDIFDYNIPQSLREICTSGNFGRWGVQDGQVPVCFLATNHTTGGNSGSPVLNADGELVGINFDRVWEGTMSDLEFDPDVCRNIALDIRYVLFTIDRIGNASYLLDEMDLQD
ncbi:MAG: S46 family peptidase [Candidatus Cryptobacteroides sp.]